METEETRREHAQALERIARETNGDVAEERRRYHASPVDGHALRGLPAIGKGVSGEIPGSSPERALMSKQPR